LTTSYTALLKKQDIWAFSFQNMDPILMSSFAELFFSVMSLCTAQTNHDHVTRCLTMMREREREESRKHELFWNEKKKSTNFDLSISKHNTTQHFSFVCNDVARLLQFWFSLFDPNETAKQFICALHTSRGQFKVNCEVKVQSQLWSKGAKESFPITRVLASLCELPNIHPSPPEHTTTPLSFMDSSNSPFAESKSNNTSKPTTTALSVEVSQKLVRRLQCGTPNLT
jgi:hypothetical protein